ncbi:hypothetical protein FSP39_002231 [Pinctada imbricata]|uniref:Endothelin-converting enzyme 1 n=1 Tax=Pinctada imbricata TaxID=66713 RepID=A0AA88XM80_PINIB|nr:hypothetical protein FSP39_002231 [Pinctada imbricata]
MDTTAEPCEDFYQYACGKWGQHFPIQKYDTSTEVLKEVGNNVAAAVKKILEEQSNNDPPSMIKAKKLYKSCMDEDAFNERGNEGIWNLLEELGGMPLLGAGRGGGWNEDSYDLEKLLAKTELPILFKLMIQENPLDSDHYTLWFSKAEYGLPDESLYKKGKNDKVMEAYMKELIGIAKLLGANENNATLDIYNVVQLEMSLAKVQNDANMDNVTVDKLGNMIPKFDWARYLKVEMGLPVETSDEFILSPVKGINRRLEILSYTPKRVELMKVKELESRCKDKKEVDKSYACIENSEQKGGREGILEAQTSSEEGATKTDEGHAHEAGSSVAEGSTSKRKDIQNSEEVDVPKKKEKTFYSTINEKESNGIQQLLYGLEASGPLWKSCVNYVIKQMPLAVGQTFIEREFSVEVKNKVTEMANDLKRELKGLIEKKDWLDEATRAGVMEKIDVLGVHIGYPDKIKNTSYVTEVYNEYNVDEKELFKNDKFIRELKLKKMISKYKTKVDDNEYVNYAMIGKIIGHEIVHAIDTNGVNFDETGSISPTWWSQPSVLSFVHKISCIIQQYSNFTDEDANMKLNGGKTSSEDVSDNGGLRATYKAYKRTESLTGVEAGLPGIDLNIDQMFFLSAAHVWCGVERPEKAKMAILTDVHSIGRFRKKGGDLQQDPVAASTVKHQNTRCKNTKDEYSTRWKRDTRHVNIKHKRLHINRRDQWKTGADFGRPSVTQVANGVVILDYVRTTLSLLQLPRGLEERTIVV